MRQIINIITFILLSLASYGQRIDTVNIFSKNFNSNRQIFVYLPWEFDTNPKQYFEVIYVFDAQIKFYTDLVNSSKFFLNHSLFNTIVIGISSEEDRNKDFLPKKEFPPETFAEKNGHFGNADKLLNFLTEEVDTLVSGKYRTLPKRIAVGHSLGATFVSFCFLQKTDFFDAYIAISPNFGYDKFQFVRRFKNFDFNKIRKLKFFYMCNSNEEIDFGKSWKTGRDSILQIINSSISKKKIKFINEDYSKSEDHSTVYPLGVRNGLKLFFDYYHNAEKLMSFYEEMYRKKMFDLTPENTNYMAYNFLWSHKPKDALKIIHWANKLFPDDLNIIDGMGEIHKENGDKATAIKYYKIFEMKLEEQKKNKLTTEKYDELKSNHEERMKSLGDK